MFSFIKNRRETIFFSTSLVIFIIVLLVTFRSIRSLSTDLGLVTDLGALRAQSEPVTFNLDKFELLGL